MIHYILYYALVTYTSYISYLSNILIQFIILYTILYTIVISYMNNQDNLVTPYLDLPIECRVCV